VEGLRQPLLAVADELDNQNQVHFSRSLREIDSILVWYVNQLKEFQKEND
jgi:hypothetical protein